jgi:hypothetical protein
VLGAIKFYVRNMGHYFFLWFTRGHKVKHLDGATAGWRYSSITLTDFLPEKILKTALRCAQFSWHFLIFSQSSDHLFVVNISCTFYFLECLVSSHIITLPFPINSGVISVWNIDGGYFSLISSCQKYRGGHARTLKIGPLDGGPRFLFEQLKGLHSCRRVRWHGRNWGLRE